MGLLLSSLADNLEAHLQALDYEAPDAKKEHQAYTSLVSQFRRVVTDLASAASEMAGYERLPLAPHDEGALSAPRVTEVFRDYVSAERELLAVLQESHASDLEMLKAMEDAEETGGS
jgi:hypothetical protein